MKRIQIDLTTGEVSFSGDLEGRPAEQVVVKEVQNPKRLVIHLISPRKEGAEGEEEVHHTAEPLAPREVMKTVEPAIPSQVVQEVKPVEVTKGEEKRKKTDVKKSNKGKTAREKSIQKKEQTSARRSARLEELREGAQKTVEPVKQWVRGKPKKNGKKEVKKEAKTKRGTKRERQIEQDEEEGPEPMEIDLGVTAQRDEVERSEEDDENSEDRDFVNDEDEEPASSEEEEESAEESEEDVKPVKKSKKVEVEEESSAGDENEDVKPVRKKKENMKEEEPVIALMRIEKSPTREFFSQPSPQPTTGFEGFSAPPKKVTFEGFVLDLTSSPRAPPKDKEVEEEVRVEEIEEVRVGRAKEVREEEPEVRRSERLADANVGFRGAFERLKAGDVDGFLTNHRIEESFFHVWTALELTKGCNSQLLQSDNTTTKMWKMHWQSKLHFDEERHLNSRVTCIMCQKGRRHGSYIKGLSKPFFVGSDCRSIKLRPLLHLVDVCYYLLNDLYRPDFEEYAPTILGPPLQKISEIPIEMKEVWDERLAK
jgi:hypothetical protein